MGGTRAHPEAGAGTVTAPAATPLVRRTGTRTSFFGGPLYQLVEVALLPLSCGFLDDQCQVVLIEALEPVVPGDLLQRLLATVAGKIEPDNPHILLTAGLLHTGRLGIAFLRPCPDSLMVN